MIIARVRCTCLTYVRIRVETAQEKDGKVKRCWHCNKSIKVSRAGGHGARIVATVDGQTRDRRDIDVDYED